MVATTVESLIEFEELIGELYTEGEIHSPVHLSKGNEKELIKIFQHIRSQDWVFSTHRNHYHALLKGIDPYWLRIEILDNKSMHINSAEHKFFTSSIVGGCLPIALGVALSLKREGSSDKVWVFVGDMGAETGSFHECVKYATGHELPITFVVEDNGMSVNTPTDKVWKYSYERGFPHHGQGKWVNF